MYKACRAINGSFFTTTDQGTAVPVQPYWSIAWIDRRKPLKSIHCILASIPMAKSLAVSILPKRIMSLKLLPNRPTVLSTWGSVIPLCGLFHQVWLRLRTLTQYWHASWHCNAQFSSNHGCQPWLPIQFGDWCHPCAHEIKQPHQKSLCVHLSNSGRKSGQGTDEETKEPTGSHEQFYGECQAS